MTSTRIAKSPFIRDIKSLTTLQNNVVQCGIIKSIEIYLIFESK